KLQAVRSFIATIERWWSLDRSVLLDLDAHRVLAGVGYPELKEFAASAAALLTVAITSELEPPPPLQNVRPRVLVDHDPGYTQLWTLMSGDTPVIGEHDLYFTVAGNLGTSRCNLPTCGLEWRHTWNPILLDWWPRSAINREWFTTVADWWGPYLEFE